MYKHALIILWLTLMLPGCGYQVGPIAPSANSDWQQTTVRIEGLGAKQDPLLAEALRQGVARQLGCDGTPVSASAPTKPHRELVIRLEPVERALHLEDRTGLADQYQIRLRAQPRLLVDGNPGKPGYPEAKSVVIYNELRTVSASQAAREQATREALTQLVDALAMLLGTTF
ncbi:MAG: hypothetical protein HQL66_13355 [Magnetococcales bacterium]|nr:hypothetical protein [Magnetococcales bacterium]